MRKFKIFTIAIALLAFFVAAPASAALQDMWANVYAWKGGMNSDGSATLTPITSGITYKVLVVDSNTAETLYYYNTPAMTALTNPVSTTVFASSVGNKLVRFRVDPTDATNDRYVDLIVVDTIGAYTAFVHNFDKYKHTIVIDERPNLVHHGMIWFGGITSDTNTGVNFVPYTFVSDVRVEVITGANGATIDVGILSTSTAGDADGFRKGVLLTTAGFVKDTAVITEGAASVDYTPVSTYGALLYTAVTGAGATYSGAGGRSYLGYVVTNQDTGAAITYTSSSTAAAGYIHYFFTRMR